MAALNRPANTATATATVAVAIFGALAVSAPLLFGASDHSVQIGLLAALALGFFLTPPVVPRLSRGLKLCLALPLAFVVAKEFLPSAWFGPTLWRTALAHDFDLAFPATHNPEPGRAVDAVLAMAAAGAWFVWVRSLAAERKRRLVLAWCLFGAAVVVAAVCLLLGHRDDWMIYGLRYTPGWRGYGPFPNRNHTATLLAMGVLVGCGCAIRSARRRDWLMLGGAIPAIALVFVAMLESKSRGGLIGFVCGLAVFGGLVLARSRTRAAVSIALSLVLLSAGLVLAFGRQLLERFASATDGSIPENLRWDIWRDTLALWRDAPWFGHGLGTFAQVFPFYQTIEAEEQIALHPESSWLLWTVELGAVAVAAAAVMLAVFGVWNLRGMFATERGFFVRAGCLAALAAVICHSALDVPAHRWAIAGWGLALLAIVCPLRAEAPRFALPRSTALVPLAIAGFWVLPATIGRPLWSPESLRTVLAKSATAPAEVPAARLENALRYFPLSAELHQALGVRYLAAATAGRWSQAWREFRLANRLVPVAWQLPVKQAWMAQPHSPGMALHFWALALERAGRRTGDLFAAAYKNTSVLPEAREFWRHYVERRPEYLLLYAESVSDASPQEARAAFHRWWGTRARAGSAIAVASTGASSAAETEWMTAAASSTAGSTGASGGGVAGTDAGGELKLFEIEYFYRCARKWATRAQIDEWMKRHASREPDDFRHWAALLHLRQDDAAAWGLLARWIKEPAFPAGRGRSVPLGTLETTFAMNPADAVNAQALAAECLRRGDAERSRQVILKVAESTANPPAWFRDKAAHLHAASGDHTSAVKLLLRDVL